MCMVGNIPYEVYNEYMIKYSFYTAALCSIILIGAGCSTTQTANLETETTAEQPVIVHNTENSVLESGSEVNSNTEAEETVEARVTLPVADYAMRRTLKTHGEFIQDRFNGYHVGDDIEFVDVTEDTPVYAIADGEVTYATTVSGYGGVIIIAHQVEGETISAVYGHVEIATAAVQVGDTVTKGDQIAILGDHESTETDGERKHLHFALYPGSGVTLAGYTSSADSVNGWLNPQDFFTQHGVKLVQPARTYNPAVDRGGDIYNISFTIPEGMEVEYVPSIESLNVYTVAGEGTARERSQFFIRYFDASDFLTLSTVTIHSTEDLTVGTDDYVARRYDIEKKPGVADFVDQPQWRNERHIVTDFKVEKGYTRYYVVAQNPQLADSIYNSILESLTAN